MFQDGDSVLGKNGVARDARWCLLTTENQETGRGYCGFDRRIRLAQEVAYALEILRIPKGPEEKQLERRRRCMRGRYRRPPVRNIDDTRVRDHGLIFGATHSDRVIALLDALLQPVAVGAVVEIRR